MFSLKWSHHQEHLMGVFAKFLATKELSDVTIMCPDQDEACKPVNSYFEAHKVNGRMICFKEQMTLKYNRTFFTDHFVS